MNERSARFDFGSIFVIWSSFYFFFCIVSTWSPISQITDIGLFPACSIIFSWCNLKLVCSLENFICIFYLWPKPNVRGQFFNLNQFLLEQVFHSRPGGHLPDVAVAAKEQLMLTTNFSNCVSIRIWRYSNPWPAGSWHRPTSPWTTPRRILPSKGPKFEPILASQSSLSLSHLKVFQVRPLPVATSVFT